MLLAVNERLTRFALRVERVEGLFETLFGRLPRVDDFEVQGKNLRDQFRLFRTWNLAQRSIVFRSELIGPPVIYCL